MYKQRIPLASSRKKDTIDIECQGTVKVQC